MILEKNTRQKVREAIPELIQEGIVPSVRSILSKIKQGSATTISNELKLWWKESADRLSSGQSLYPDVPKDVINAAVSLYETALLSAKDSLRNDWVELGNTKVENQVYLNRKEEEFQKITLTNAALEKQLEELFSENRDLRDNSVSERTRIAILEKEIFDSKVEKERLMNTIDEQNGIHQKQVNDLQDSLRGVEKHMLMQIDEARQGTRKSEDRERRTIDLVESKSQIFESQIVQLRSSVQKLESDLRKETQLKNELSEKNFALLSAFNLEQERLKHAESQIQEWKNKFVENIKDPH